MHSSTLSCNHNENKLEFCYIYLPTQISMYVRPSVWRYIFCLVGIVCVPLLIRTLSSKCDLFLNIMCHGKTSLRTWKHKRIIFINFIIYTNVCLEGVNDDIWTNCKPTITEYHSYFMLVLNFAFHVKRIRLEFLKVISFRAIDENKRVNWLMDTDYKIQPFSLSGTKSIVFWRLIIFWDQTGSFYCEISYWKYYNDSTVG